MSGALILLVAHTFLEEDGHGGMMIQEKIFLSIIAIVAFLVISASHADEKTEENVPYHTIGVEDFQSFVKNWDTDKHPVLHALIQTPAQWEEIFGSAALMEAVRNRPFSPNDKQFEKEQLVIIARVMFPSEEMFSKAQTIFQVEKVTASDKELTLSYRVKEPKTQGSFTVKNYVGVWIPKHNYRKVSFIENGKPIGTLELSKGQWNNKLP